MLDAVEQTSEHLRASGENGVRRLVHLLVISRDPERCPNAKRKWNKGRDVPATARRHFDEDIACARDLLTEAVYVPPARQQVAGSLQRAAVAFAVGAMDAYLCDAYTDSLALCMKAYKNGQLARLPDAYRKAYLPVGPLLATHYTKRFNWSLRMAARSLMERENMLKVTAVRDMFNPALPIGKKLWPDVIDSYAALNRRRLTRHRKDELDALAGKPRADAQREAVAMLMKRMGFIVQRRHDIVHNLDRPKTARQHLTPQIADWMIRDVEAFVTVLDDHLDLNRIA